MMRLILMCLSVTGSLYAQDYFPLGKNSYWIYNVYKDSKLINDDSTVYNADITRNDTVFYKFIHHYRENNHVANTDTILLYHNPKDKNTVMRDKRNQKAIYDTAIYAKHIFTSGDWWKYQGSLDTIKVKHIGDYTVTAGAFHNCYSFLPQYIFAPNVGVIKMYQGNASSFSDLVRYYIASAPASVLLKQTDKPAIYPNPVVNYIHIKGDSTYTYTIANNNGMVCKMGKSTDGIIDASNLKTGLYFIKLSNNQASVTYKIVKR